MIGLEVDIGSGCKIQNNVSVYQGLTLEDDLFCGPSIVFTNIYNPTISADRVGVRVREAAGCGFYVPGMREVMV
ncbi:MAG: hypothetical protein U5L07_02740 [Desulfobacterales bacterium]|nr:hypothetical protein [Desulfobacterales bacterium]